MMVRKTSENVNFICCFSGIHVQTSSQILDFCVKKCVKVGQLIIFK